MSETKRDEFYSLFDTEDDAAEFESRCISVEAHLLPSHTMDVRDGHVAPDDRYWAWLVAQYDSPLPVFAAADAGYDLGYMSEDLP